MNLIAQITDGFVRTAEEFRKKATYDHVSQVADDLIEYLENSISSSQAWITDNYAPVHTHPYRADTWLPGWADVTGKPTTFDPSAHTHPYRADTWVPGWADVTGKPSLFSGSYTDLTNTPLTFAPSAHTHPYRADTWVPGWTDVTGKPTTFDPSAHTHPYRADTWVPGWTDVTGKPTTFNPSVHTHPYRADTWLPPNDHVATTVVAANGLSISGQQISMGTPWTALGYLTAITKAMIEAQLTGSITSHTHSYDNYGSWGLTADAGVTTLAITSGSPVGFVGLGGSVVTRSGGSIYVDSPALGTGSTNAAYGNHTHSGVYQTLDADLTAIAALAGTSGLLKKTAANTWTLDTTSYLTALPGHSIGTHSDVFLSGLTNGQILLYWSGYWSNKTLADSGIQAAITTGTDQQYLKGDLTLGTFAHTHNYEPTLGNPVTNGYVLSSTSGGTRSWIAQSGGIADAASNSLIYGRYNATWVNLASSFAALNGSGTTDFSMQAGIFGTGGYSSAWSIKNETGTLSFAYAGSSKATLTSAGVFTAAELYRGSSRELKYDIQPFTVNAMQMLNNVLITDYKLKSNDQYAIGFIAEDTHPWLSGIHQKAHSFGNHLALLTKAIQEEDDKITVLQNQVIALQNQVLVLQNNQKTN